MKRSFHPARVKCAFAVPGGDDLPVRINGTTANIAMPHLYRFAPEAFAAIEVLVQRGGIEELASLAGELEGCECVDRLEEIEVLLDILRSYPDKRNPGEGEMLQKRILWLLRKFAHRKYREIFERTLGELRAFGRREPERFALLVGGLAEVAELAEARFAG
jgi:hypothetical protein